LLNLSPDSNPGLGFYDKKINIFSFDKSSLLERTAFETIQISHLFFSNGAIGLPGSGSETLYFR
jgi:hypothetical protein